MAGIIVFIFVGLLLNAFLFWAMEDDCKLDAFWKCVLRLSCLVPCLILVIVVLWWLFYPLQGLKKDWMEMRWQKQESHKVKNREMKKEFHEMKDRLSEQDELLKAAMQELEKLEKGYR